MLREYIPVLLQFVVAVGFAVSAIIVSIILGKTGKRTRIKDTAYECGMVPQGEAAAVQREVLPGGDALHPVRSRDRLHVSVGGRLPGGDRREQS